MMKIATHFALAASLAIAGTAQADTTANLGSFGYYGAHKNLFSDSRAPRPASTITDSNTSNTSNSSNSSNTNSNSNSSNSSSNSNTSVNTSDNNTANAAPSASVDHLPVLIETNMDNHSGSGSLIAPAAELTFDAPPAAGNAEQSAPPATVPFNSDAPQGPASAPQTAASDALSPPADTILLVPTGNDSPTDSLGDASPNGTVGAAADIPEPATPALIGLALIGFALRRKAGAKRQA